MAIANASSRPHRVAVLALDRVLPLEVGIPFLVFDWPDLPSYSLTLCAREAGPVKTDNGWSLVAPHGLDALDDADTVVVPAFHDFLDGVPQDVAAALGRAHRRGARIASICTGAFALASAGLLSGKRATTHWLYADELARRYPDVEVDPGVLFVDADDVVTSAGVASGIDLCLHLLRRDHGAATSNRIARRIVAAPYRNGGQAQFIERPTAPANRTHLSDTLEWALARLDQPLTVAGLAAHAGLSERSFARSFVAETGITPMRWLNAARVEHARELLETSDATIGRIARLCGLGTPANFRQHFRHATGVTPSAYRGTFAAN